MGCRWLRDRSSDPGVSRRVAGGATERNPYPVGGFAIALSSDMVHVLLSGLRLSRA